MTDEQLKKLHELLLMLAMEVNRIAEKNHLKYTLLGGTLLGAVRHKGFIPWDDDLDLGMVRSEYDKFIEACKTDLDDRFELVTTDTDCNYVYGFAKIIIKGTYLVQKGHEQSCNQKGIFIDIFPFDAIPDSNFKRKKQKFKNYLYIKMLRQKNKIADEEHWGIKEKLIFRCIDFICLFQSKKTLVKKLHKNMKRYNNTECRYMSNMSGFYGYTHETLPKNYFDEYVDIIFENVSFKAVKNYIKVLEHYYGDYMKLPPEDQRRTHEFQQLDFGSY